MQNTNWIVANNHVLKEVDKLFPRYWEEVFFAQNEKTEKWLNLIKEKGPKFVIKELLNDYWFQGEHMTRVVNPKGKGDNSCGRWVEAKEDIYAELSWNNDLQYIGFTVTYREDI